MVNSWQVKAVLHKNRRVVHEIDHKATGKSFRSERERLGVSLRKFALAIGYSAPFVSDLERGERRWDEERLAAFNTKLAELAKKAK